MATKAKGAVWPTDGACREELKLLAERLVRRSVTAQYVGDEHPVVQTENDLIAQSMEALRPHTAGRTPLEMMTIRMALMNAAEWDAESRELDDDIRDRAMESLEEDSYRIMAELCVGRGLNPHETESLTVPTEAGNG